MRKINTMNQSGIIIPSFRNINHLDEGKRQLEKGNLLKADKHFHKHLKKLEQQGLDRAEDLLSYCNVSVSIGYLLSDVRFSCALHYYKAVFITFTEKDYHYGLTKIGNILLDHVKNNVIRFPINLKNNKTDHESRLYLTLKFCESLLPVLYKKHGNSIACSVILWTVEQIYYHIDKAKDGIRYVDKLLREYIIPLRLEAQFNITFEIMINFFTYLKKEDECVIYLINNILPFFEKIKENSDKQMMKDLVIRFIISCSREIMKRQYIKHINKEILKGSKISLDEALRVIFMTIRQIRIFQQLRDYIRKLIKDKPKTLNCILKNTVEKLEVLIEQFVGYLDTFQNSI